MRSTKGYRLWLGTFTTVLALFGRAACVNFIDSAWQMQPAGPLSIAREIKDTVVVTVEVF